MSDVRRSRAAIVSLGLGVGTFAFYLLAGLASPLIGAVGIIFGLWGLWAIRRGRGGLRGYHSAALGIAFGLAQFILMFRLGPGPDGGTVNGVTVTAT
jgi:hypothetical protein